MNARNSEKAYSAGLKLSKDPRMGSVYLLYGIHERLRLFVGLETIIWNFCF